VTDSFASFEALDCLIVDVFSCFLLNSGRLGIVAVFQHLEQVRLWEHWSVQQLDVSAASFEIVHQGLELGQFQCTVSLFFLFLLCLLFF